MKIYNDFLNRDDDLNIIYDIVINAINKNKSLTISLDGSWGVGKTWILNKLEMKLKGFDISKEKEMDNYSSDYFVFKYNAWENDYFSEPLIAILTSFCSQINKMNVIELNLKNFTKKEIKKNFKKILNLLEYSISNISKKTLGFDVVKKVKSTVKFINDINNSSNININANDNAIGIDKDIDNVVNALKCLSAIKPIIFIVDELDRCIPEFAIKTLERLHHVFNKVNNSLVIVSVDEKQLKRSIENMYGKHTPVQQYLKKFFKFHININKGHFDKNLFINKIKSLTERYNIIDSKEIDIIKEVMANLLCIYNAREKINLLDKLSIISFLNNQDNGKLGFYILLGEITLLVVKDCFESGEIILSQINPTTQNQPENNLELYLKNDLFNIKIEKSKIGNIIPVNFNDYKTVIFYILNRYFKFSLNKIYIDEKDNQYVSYIDNYFDKINKYLLYIRY